MRNGFLHLGCEVIHPVNMFLYPMVNVETREMPYLGICFSAT